jgi:DNA polymerase-3 subunit beta
MTLEALRRVSILEEKTKRIYLGLKKNSITMYIEENDKGNSEEEFECQYDGEEARISLNHEYLEDPLKSIDTDEAVIRFTETSKAILIESVPKSDYFHIVMPMQEP